MDDIVPLLLVVPLLPFPSMISVYLHLMTDNTPGVGFGDEDERGDHEASLFMFFARTM